MSAVVVDTSRWDRYRQLEAQAASLSGLIASATARLVEVVEAVEREGQWEGHRSVEAWTALKCGTSGGHARQLVATARGLRDLPAVRAAFEAGSITADHVAVMVNRGLTVAHEDQALNLAAVASVAQLGTALSFLPQPDTDAAERPAPSPSVSFGQRDNGMWRAVIELFPEDGALLAKAFEAGRDEVFRDTHPDLDGDPDPRAVRKETTWVDGVKRTAHRALDALDPATRAGRGPSDRYQVHLHVRADSGAAHWHLGPSVSDSVRRLLCCDTDITAWVDDANHTLGMGRRQRLANRRLRRTVEHRDRRLCGTGLRTTPLADHPPHLALGRRRTHRPPQPRRHLRRPPPHGPQRSPQPRRQPRHRPAQSVRPPRQTDLRPDPPTHPANRPTSPPAASESPHPATSPRSGEHADWSWFRWQ